MYDLPWPVTDRDLCVDVVVTIDPLTRVSKVIASPAPGLMAEQENMIRIKDYHQTWTVKPIGPDKAHVELEGFVDPAGTIPDWICNMIIVDSPIKVFTAIRQKLEKN